MMYQAYELKAEICAQKHVPVAADKTEWGVGAPTPYCQVFTFDTSVSCFGAI